MTEVKWIKIVTDIFDDEKIILIESMPDGYAIIVAWFKLLCLAGKQNNSGVFVLNDKLPYTDEMLATIFRMPLNTVRLALNTFEKFGMIEIVNGAVTIPKWGKHQNLEGIEKVQSQTRERVQAYRERQKAKAIPEKISEDVTLPVTLRNVTVTHTDIDIDKELDKDKDKDKEIDINPPIVPPKGDGVVKSPDTAFDMFWSAYPRKVGKADARKAWKKIKGVDLGTVLSAVERLKRSEQWTRENGKYIPHPATWLNRGGWDDEEPEALPTMSKTAQQLNNFYDMANKWAEE